MKIFNKDDKVNFVDDNNVFVGFEYAQSCGAGCGWSITRYFPTDCQEGENGIDPSGFQFDRNYCVRDVPGGDVDDGGVVVFRLVRGNEEIFLMLWNAHNGYYGQGFDMVCGNEQIYEGVL